MSAPALSPVDRAQPAAPSTLRGNTTWRRWLVPVLTLAILMIATMAVRDVLRTTNYDSVMRAVNAVPRRAVLSAVALTIACYLVLPMYDLLGLRYARTPIPLLRSMQASFFAYAFSQTLGFAAITGGAVRLRFWTAAGLTTSDVARAASFSGIGFWLGMLTTCGLALTFETLPTAVLGYAPSAVLRAVGVLLLAIVACYVLVASVRRRPIAVAGMLFSPPGPILTGLQLVVAAADWTLASAVLWALLPSTPGLSFVAFLGAFALAQAVGLVSHVPGGLGVFDALMVLLLTPHGGAPQALASLVAYRAIYYLLPFILAASSLSVLVIRQRRERITHAARATVRIASRWGPTVLPTALSGATFVAGLILLLSGALPAENARIAAIDGVLPLGVIEVSHLTGSLLGAALLVLAWALRRRLDAAWVLGVVALSVGIVVSLLKGLDVEEAVVLSTVLAVLIPSRSAFHRRAALLAEPLEPEWIIAIVAAIGASIAFGMFAYRHVDYDNDLWWRFTRHGDAPRFLRATTAVLGSTVLLAFWRLMRHAPGEPALPDTITLARAATVVAHASDTRSNLALLGDKALLMDDADRAMLMYGIEGRSWIALGDPIGEPAAAEELAWRFRELADRHGGWTVFYEVGTERLPLYIDLGLSLLKLGEEAIVPLADFGLDGSARKGLRRVVKDAEKKRVTFEMVPVEQVGAIMPDLQRISDAWLAEKLVREKGFSLGRFDPAYLQHHPMAVVRHEGELVAFANVWCGAEHSELSVDLMRWTPSAPGGMMDFLFVQLMLWGKAEGYGHFNLGMAPLSGLDPRALAPLWNRAGSLVFRFGEHFYNFRGLRQYKDKFDPIWEPRYLASPGGLVLPRILTNVAALISGGLGGIFHK
ncbi:bifunctional lysylphosphatidylglycerol flippase/synthetase MprF [Gemmatimonas sp.]|uniref:bifunctional lysylphosphatidylglycerol flippase/synthetase MprF n=1 Tax=Gemmatimonas sp. TaxID=1962908 RepID=UPI00398325B5